MIRKNYHLLSKTTKNEQGDYQIIQVFRTIKKISNRKELPAVALTADNRTQGTRFTTRSSGKGHGRY